MDGRMVLVEVVDVGFEAANVPLLDAMRRGSTLEGVGELRLGHEELVLEPADDGSDVRERLGELAGYEAEKRPELVVRPVSPDPRGILLYAGATGKTGRASVARPGIETRDTLASGLHGSWSRGELSPWTGQYEMCSTSLCLASCRHSRQMNPLRSLQAIPIGSMLQPYPTIEG